MKLQSKRGEGFVLHGHDVTPLIMSTCLESCRDLVDNQGMISGRFKMVRGMSQQPGGFFVEGGGFAKNELLRRNDMRSKTLSQTLVPQADAQDRDPAVKIFDQRHADARIIRGTGTGADDQFFRLQGNNLFN